ncbi:hypothetical protein DOTSEDRAFT_29045 [Dothistroma septosporum NZE10]|uniref:Uncharacterized protein n=1 Tax=Dothistroma septosporum (strain NZE10 / CBS 128990) TaxID=675120 RepID=M2YIU3_DOTSN|nr:hypothetical protein DOTSEDRAFT_29045 [Dothistroma septosporum NZE10]
MISPHKKISGLVRPEPAPQYALAQESEHFLTSLFDKINQLAVYTGSDCRVSPEEYESDVASMQRFIAFVLATDYQVTISVKLSKQDRVHLHGLHKALGDLGKVWPSRRPTHPERHPLAPYFWQYLHVPCIALGICTEVVIAMVYRFAKYSTNYGGYRGCALSLAHNEGCGVLAQKLSIDSMLLFYVAANGDKALLARFQTASAKVAALYFDRIHHFIGEKRGIQHLWSNTRCARYDLNERGKLYQQRKTNATLARHYQLALWVHKQQDGWSLWRQEADSEAKAKTSASKRQSAYPDTFLL